MGARIQVIAIAALLTTACGCSMLDSGVRNLVIEPSHFPGHLDEFWTRQRNRQLAAEAWQHLVDSSPEVTSVSEDYARGFQAGYADFLFYGGSGEPPAVPPRDYWRLDERAGVRKPCVTDWFSGFRHGVTVAGHQGYREMEEIPTELLLPFETDHYAESDGAWMDKVTDVSVWRGQTQNEMDEVVEPREAVAPEDVELIAPPEPDDGWRQRDARDLEP